MNTSRALMFGIGLLCVASMVWALVLRKDVSQLNNERDQGKLRYEALLAEKLSGDKKREKDERKMERLMFDTARLSSSFRSAQETNARISKELSETERLLISVQHHLDRTMEMNKNLTLHLKSSADSLNRLTKTIGTQKDSIVRLRGQAQALDKSLQEAVARSIDKTLVLAEKSNGKATSKARQTRELMAEVELPSELTDLRFTVESSDGTILSHEGILTSRQMVDNSTLTASTEDFANAGDAKRMQVVYVPNKKLARGIYVFKVYSKDSYVGSMKVKLE